MRGVVTASVQCLLLQVLYKFLVECSGFDWERYCLSLQGPIPLAVLAAPPPAPAPPPQAQPQQPGGSQRQTQNACFHSCVISFIPTVAKCSYHSLGLT